MSALPKPRFEFTMMGEADLDAVAAAEARIHAFPWTRGNFADSLAAGHGAWIAFEGGVPAGHAVAMRVLDEAQLLTIGVLPECRRTGVGTSLLEHLLAEARREGAARMFLEVRAMNEPAQAFYRRHGFAVIGHRRGYYPAEGGREDAVVMAREL